LLFAYITLLLTGIPSFKAMRLLKLEGDGGFSLVEVYGDEIPEYAILSHTWGTPSEEVTFADVMERTGTAKIGYRKLLFCAKQAAADRLQHMWIDTCCIDRSSSAELSECINSMFRWYSEAVKCYVYLADVSTAEGSRSTGEVNWKRAFRKSRWFTRGWTLQELLAPTTVEFFSKEGDKIGDKKSLVARIHKITGISVQALEGKGLSDFSVNERLSWAQNRQTKREEDAAYSLLGIFDIHMPLIYGEGRKKALARLHKDINESMRDMLNTLPESKPSSSAEV
jgi:hypothetical protein